MSPRTRSSCLCPFLTKYARSAPLRRYNSPNRFLVGEETKNNGLLLTYVLCTGRLQVAGCVRIPTIFPDSAIRHRRARLTSGFYSVQVNIPAETGDMGVLASHVPSIEQLRPGLVEVIEESAGSKQFFRTSPITHLGP